ncbi:hypothetical protein NDU88_003617 [Pleurodeles waltl]|uniref:Uncharacterized protein n=1 Tax=Pleurodeles waltl TaxID=8319 RepID=A0AAV7VGI3_PLEWA|nr:hypothetical protein NDU88_003617 [Pleurodeles waltl]
MVCVIGGLKRPSNDISSPDPAASQIKLPALKSHFRHIRRPVYNTMTSLPHFHKNPEDSQPRYKTLDQRIRMKKIQHISLSWTKK